MNTFLKILFLWLVFSTSIYFVFITGLWEVISNFNEFVAPFFPSELIFIFALFWFWLIYKLYLSFK